MFLTTNLSIPGGFRPKLHHSDGFTTYAFTVHIKRCVMYGNNNNTYAGEMITLREGWEVLKRQRISGERSPERVYESWVEENRLRGRPGTR